MIRSSARNLRREVGDQVRKVIGGPAPQPGDVWSTATTEPPAEVGEAPECAWCPVCRAARRMRESRPGLGSQLAGAGDAVALVVSDALGALDAALSRAGSAADHARGPAGARQPERRERPEEREQREGREEHEETEGPGEPPRDGCDDRG